MNAVMFGHNASSVFLRFYFHFWMWNQVSVSFGGTAAGGVDSRGMFGMVDFDSLFCQGESDTGNVR